MEGWEGEKESKKDGGGGVAEMQKKIQKTIKAEEIREKGGTGVGGRGWGKKNDENAEKQTEREQNNEGEQRRDLALEE